MNNDRVTMAADSTQKGEPKKQHETPSEKRANKRKKILQERRAKKLKRSQPKKRKNRSRSRSRGDSDSDCESDLDLGKELKPVGDYVHHREEMLEHMFRSISNKKLKAMMPECVKELNLAELKTLCLEQLDMMSRKRILRILDGADPDTISSTDTEDDSTEEEDNVSESGSTEGSVGESHTSEPVVDGSQSQRIDSTSLQEDQYSECSDSTHGSPKSHISGEAYVAADCPENVQDEVGGDELDMEGVAVAEEEAEEEIAEETIEELEQPVNKDGLRETKKVLEEIAPEEEKNQVQDEQEEGEVEEDDMEVGTEELKISSNKVEKPEEGKKAEASAEMEELQVSVPQAEMEGLLGSDPQSPEEGEVFDDEPPQLQERKPSRSQKTSRRQSSSSSKTRSRRPSRNHPVQSKTTSLERKSSSSSQSKRKERSKSSDAGRGDKKSVEPSAVKIIKKSENIPSLQPSQKEGLAVKAKDGSKTDDTKAKSRTEDKKQPAVMQKVATEWPAPLSKNEKGKAPIPARTRETEAAAVQQKVVTEPGNSKSERSDNETKLKVSKVMTKPGTSTALPSGGRTLVGKEDSSMVKLTQEHVPLRSKGASPITRLSTGSQKVKPVQPEQDKLDSEKQLEIEARAILGRPAREERLPDVVSAGGKETVKPGPKKSAISPTGKIVAGKVVPKSVGGAPQSQNISSSTTNRSVLMPNTSATQALPMRAETKKLVKIKRPGVPGVTSAGSEQVVVEELPLRTIEQKSSRVVEPPKRVVEQSKASVQQPPPRVVIKRDESRQEIPEIPQLPSEPQRRVQLKSSPPAPMMATTAPSSSGVQPSSSRRTVLKRPHSLASDGDPVVPMKVSPRPSSTQSGSQIQGQGAGGRTVIQRSSSAPVAAPDTGADAEDELSPNQMEILELEMRARAIKAMLKSQVPKSSK